MLSRCLGFVCSVRRIVLQKRILGRRVRRALHRRLATVTSLDLALGGAGASTLQSLIMNAAIMGYKMFLCYIQLLTSHVEMHALYLRLCNLKDASV
jgi:hypothetical protein